MSLVCSKQHAEGDIRLQHLMSGVTVMQWNAQNTESEVQVMIFNYLSYADLFSLLQLPQGHLTFSICPLNASFLHWPKPYSI